MSTMNIEIEEDLQQSLEIIIKDIHRPKNWIINEALREYLTRRKLEKKRWKDTLEALEDIRKGNIVDGDKVHAWLESWGDDNELEAP